MSFQLQQTIKNNASDLREYVKDLYDWQEQMEYKEKIKSKNRQQQQKKRKQYQKMQQQRQKQQKQQKQKIQSEKNKQQPKRKKQLIRDTNTVQDYYKAWDKYDVDKELQKLQQEQMGKYKPYNPYEDTKNNKKAKPKTGLVIKGNRNANIVKDPTSLKDKGNLHFKVSQFQKAVDCYSDCLHKIQERQMQIKGKNQQEEDKTTKQRNKLKAVVFSNRAMALMKLNQTAKALLDCNQSLKYDPKYIKTYLRRADCFKRLGHYKDSLNDYKMAKQISPEQKEAETQIRKLEAYINKKVKQTHDNMIIQNIPQAIPSGYRIQIEDVEQFEQGQEQEQNLDMQQKKQANYLQQL